jgi:hypothetical protein
MGVTRVVSMFPPEKAAAQGLAPHPPLRIVRQWQSCRQYREEALQVSASLLKLAENHA